MCLTPTQRTVQTEKSRLTHGEWRAFYGDLQAIVDTFSVRLGRRRRGATCQLELYAHLPREDGAWRRRRNAPLPSCLDERYASAYFDSVRKNPGDSLIRHARMLRVARDGDNGVNDVDTMPVSVASTRFHFLVLFPRELVVIRKADEARVFSMPLCGSTDSDSLSARNGVSEAAQWWGLSKVRRDLSFCGFLRDSETSALWIWSSREVWSLAIGDEGNMEGLLKRALAGSARDFETALEHCRTAANRSRVRDVQAKYFFRSKQYDLAAKCFARTNSSLKIPRGCSWVQTTREP